MRIFFEQIQYQLWTEWCPIAAFGISFSVFLGCLWYAFRMPAKNLDQMAQLPFDESESSTTSPIQPNDSHAN